MTNRRIAWLALVFCALAIGAIAGNTIFTLLFWSQLSAIGGDTDPNIVVILSVIVIVTTFGTVGALIVVRHTTNVVGWIFIGTNLNFAFGNVASNYAAYALQIASTPLPGGRIAAWWADIGNTPGAFLPYVFLFLVFPNGRLLSRRWRPLAWFSLGLMVLWPVSVALSPGRLRTFPFVDNPFGIEPLKDFLGVLGMPLLLGTIFSSLLSPFALILRFRRSTGDERQQLKWFAAASVYVAVVFVSGPFIWAGIDPTIANWLWPLLFATAITALPVAAGIAIFRYRLYDIDVIINRTLVYGALTLTLALVYLGLVVVLQGLVRAFAADAQYELVTVVSTLTIAALFQPLRNRIQQMIDRRFYRHKYDAAKTLAAFNSRLRNEVDLRALSDDVLAVVDDTLQPAHVSLWLRPTSRKGSGTSS